MWEIFNSVYQSLMWLASVTGLTYFEVNIILYYIIVPFVYIALLDKIFNFHYLKAGFILFVCIFFLSIGSFSAFSDKAFVASQDFLLSFEFIGLNYIASSVVFCVIVPLIVLLILIRIVRKKKKSSIEKIAALEKN